MGNTDQYKEKQRYIRPAARKQIEGHPQTANPGVSRMEFLCQYISLKKGKKFDYS